MKILSKIKGVFTFAQFIITVIITIVFMYIFRKNHRKVRRIWAKSQRFLIGYDIHVKGDIDENAKLVLANHQGAMDIVALEELHPKDLCWVTKKEIEDIPIFGRIVHAPSMISVAREDKRSLVKLLKDAKDRIEKGRVIAIFPEGTRSDGKRLLEFKQGAKFIAEKLDLKVLPVVITGSSEVFDTKTAQTHGKDITINFLPSVTPKAGTFWYEQLQEDMRKVLEDELANNPSNR
ncbi:MAG: 1-acyl-sn-glycerol-3-phosphate acyltransferase [Proteobacteria bacterium]|nr:MAG: 1-acyl-sn-glycerol-3-phosphate acyltransferase [Pseudomonadota bacterium]